MARSDEMLYPEGNSSVWQAEALRLSEERFCVLFGGVKNCAVILLDPDGCVASWNAGAELIKGYEADEIIGQHFSLFYPPEDVARGKPERQLEMARTQGESEDVGWRIRKDGSRFYANAVLTALFDESGQLRGYAKATRDVSDERGTEASLRSVVDHVIDGIITIDSTGIVNSFNPAAERIFGYTAADVIGQNVKMLMPDPYYGEHDGYIANYVASGQAKIIGIGREVVGRRRDGSTFPMDLAVSTFQHAGFRFFTGIVRDITDRKRLERELRERVQELGQAEERMRSVVNHVVDGIITIDERGTIESFNPAAEQIFGYTAAEVMGQNVKVLMPMPYHAEHDGYILNYLTSGQAKIIGIGREVIGKRKDGSTFPMDLAVSEFHLEQRRYFTGIVRDITERKRLEDELQQRVQELAEADRRKDQFLATLAHELRNPLAPIVSATQLLHSRGPSVAELQWAQGVIDRQVEQMVRLVDDLLDISRITRGKVELRKEPVEVAKVVHNAVESCRPLIDRANHQLQVSLPAQPILLDVDPMRMAQVVLNLLNNAAKFTPAGGKIVLTVEQTSGDEVRILVKDSGIGIPADMLTRVFEMFTQVDNSLERAHGGLGIGLSLAKGLVELHGGSIEAQSAGAGQGTELIVRLPLPSDRTTCGAVAAPMDGNASATPAWRIVMIDDNRDVADCISKLLKAAGNDVEAAYDGPSALELIHAYRPDIVLCDIGMPGMNGYDVARKLREHPQFAKLVLIAVSGWGQAEDRRRSIEAGFNDHIAKPVRIEVLLETFEQHCRRP